MFPVDGPPTPRKARALARIAAAQGVSGGPAPAVRPARMSADDRRQQVVAAASRAFAVGGYAGTTTDDVAKAAGVSQPYVVRMFGGKEQLFIAVFRWAVDGILRAFQTELDRIAAEGTVEPDSDEMWAELGAAYLELVADRTIVLVLMHGFSVSGAEPAIGQHARQGMGEIYRALRDRTGASVEKVQEFIAHGMLLNILMAMQVPEHAAADSPLFELASCCFGPELTAELAAS